MEHGGITFVSLLAMWSILLYISYRSKTLIKLMTQLVDSIDWRYIRSECEQLFCFVCTYLGVISTIAWTSSLLPLTDMTAILVSTLSPVSSIAVAARVYDVQSHNRWERQQNKPLVMRILLAYSDGVMWLRWLRKNGE